MRYVVWLKINGRRVKIDVNANSVDEAKTRAMKQVSWFKKDDDIEVVAVIRE